ncbi:head maturation protease, ClpP-related [Telluria beijingensis]|uniref:head maturation protease, ClpP-related n=1 Tax=Telluria beijingensis TaxID=3068633 RepID=UPI0027959FF6|nr:head maturation protease, ClpP-related [Massilia sp. REN29]
MNPFFQLCLDNTATAHVSGKREILVSNAAGQTLFIRGVIAPGFEANAADIVAAIEMADPTKDLNLHFNTPGGSVFEGKEIAAAIRNFPGKTIANIVSLCASAGTSIAIACSEVVMQKGAFFMIHNAQGAAFGDKSVLRDTANVMEKIELTIVDDYATKTGKPTEEIIAMMEDETWMTADEALAGGFIDRIADHAGVSNAWNLSAYAKAPPALAKSIAAAAQDSAPVLPPAENIPPPEAVAPEPTGPRMTQANANRLALAIAA